MCLESLLGAGWRSIVVGQSKVGDLGQNRVGANTGVQLQADAVDIGVANLDGGDEDVRVLFAGLFQAQFTLVSARKHHLLKNAKAKVLKTLTRSCAW
jgi:hypothetical protein